MFKVDAAIAGEGYTSGVQLKDGDRFVSRPLKDAVLNAELLPVEVVLVTHPNQ